MTIAERPKTHAGSPVDRIDGPLKVTGAAPYAADAPVEHPLFAVLVQSTISRGHIRSIDERAARAVAGVVEILTYRNAPRLEPTGFDFATGTLYTEPRLVPLQTDAVRYWGQHLAVVIATSLEAALTAAPLVHITYAADTPAVEIDTETRARKERVESFFGSPLNVERGDPDAALRAAAVTLDVTYTTPAQTHNAMEPSATVASWSGDELTVYDATQWINGTQKTLAHFFGLDPKKVRVISPFTGGGFGSKGFFWAHTVIAAMAAKAIGKTVKLVLDRSQFFSASGHRSETEQRIRIGATETGALTALVHDVLDTTGYAGDFTEPCGKSTDFLYAVPNMRVSHHTVRLDIPTPTAMRAPGETPGLFAIESAIDELADAVNVDPLELRIRNHAERDPQRNIPFSSKHLLECYRTGAERFGWAKRTPEPRSMRAGRELIGYGMATATYPAMAGAAEVRVRTDGGGRVTVECATHDLGTGMYTLIAQVASDTLEIQLADVTVKIGDSAYPKAPVAGGSQSTASVMPPLVDACEQLKRRAGGPIANAAAGLEATASASGEVDEEKHAFHSFGAQFCEVRFDEELARLRVTRFTGVYDCGRVLNPKTARSQMIGGIIMGLGMALMEETFRDPRSGAIVGNNLADYHVPVNADVPPIDIAFVEHPDLTFNALGARGMGEIGITGVAAAVANAVYHASGRRVRDLPILPERLM
ncbi:MAG: xanthine dehydrogenase family protein molybdopterin-binding subunit [Candidatus Lustribacter sp.]|jgi:xanthine dehydrogenase YagR molybdenum-binding subunit